MHSKGIDVLLMHIRAGTGPFGYDPKSAILETAMLSIYTTDL